MPKVPKLSPPISNKRAPSPLIAWLRNYLLAVNRDTTRTPPPGIPSSDGGVGLIFCHFEHLYFSANMSHPIVGLTHKPVAALSHPWRKEVFITKLRPIITTIETRDVPYFHRCLFTKSGRTGRNGKRQLGSPYRKLHYLIIIPFISH